MPNLDAIAKHEMPETTLRVDIDQVGQYYPTLACIPNGKNEANDDVSISSAYVDGEKSLLFRFKSEVSGSRAIYGLEQGFGKYSIVLTEKGNLFAVVMKKEDGKETEVPDFSNKYKLDGQDRATLLVAQALHCYAYSQADLKQYDRFEAFASLADYLDDNRSSLTVPDGAISFKNDSSYQCGRSFSIFSALCHFGQSVADNNGGW